MSTEPNAPIPPDWPSASQYRRSIGKEFAFYVGGFVVILLLVAGLVVSRQFVAAVTSNVVDKLLVQARSYAGAAGKQIIAADGPDVLMLSDICRKLMADNPECRWAGIADEQDGYLAHSDMKQIVGGARFVAPANGERRSEVAAGEILSVDDESILVAVPIVEHGMTVGRLALSASTNQIAAARRSALVTMSLITLVMAAVAVPVTMVILRRRLRPLYRITEALRKVEIGNLRVDPEVHTGNEFGFLADTLRVMGSKLELARSTAIEAERMTRELEIAHEIQANILPHEHPRGTGFSVAGVYRSARTVGGDYYDFIDLGGDRLGIVIGDVSGKSLPGMLVMLLTRDLVMKHALRTEAPASLLSAVNRDLLPQIRQGTFVTMFYGVLQTVTGEFEFASAGHNPIIQIDGRTGEIRQIKTKGFPLGMIGQEQFDRRIESSRLQLNPDDWCLLYTDGINEAMDSQSNIYGMKRFLEVASRGRSESPECLSRMVMDDVNRFVGDSPQSDDITLLALKWSGVRDARVERETVGGTACR